jgi:hypothetical protein
MASGLAPKPKAAGWKKLTSLRSPHEIGNKYGTIRDKPHVSDLQKRVAHLDELESPLGGLRPNLDQYSHWQILEIGFTPSEEDRARGVHDRKGSSPKKGWPVLPEENNAIKTVR